jgi:hypothetical protein
LVGWDGLGGNVGLAIFVWLRVIRRPRSSHVRPNYGSEAANSVRRAAKTKFTSVVNGGDSRKRARATTAAVSLEIWEAAVGLASHIWSRPSGSGQIG